MVETSTLDKKRPGNERKGFVRTLVSFSVKTKVTTLIILVSERYEWIFSLYLKVITCHKLKRQTISGCYSVDYRTLVPLQPNPCTDSKKIRLKEAKGEKAKG
jgi:hypothetical protein